GCERSVVAHREVGEDLAIDLDAGEAQAGDEAAVAGAVQAATRVDALDPELAHLALAGPAVTEGVLPRVHDRFVGRPEAAAAVAVVTLRLAEYGAALLLRVNST